MIGPIENLTPILGGRMSRETKLETEGEGTFGAIFRTAIDNVKQTDAEKTEAEYLLATGQLDNPASLTIAATKNELAVSLLVQLRNKALDAYSELTRINL